MPSERALVWEKKLLGDCVLSTPALMALHEAGLLVEVWGAPVLPQLFAQEPYASAVSDKGKHRGLAGLRQQVRSLRQAGITHAILVNRNFHSALAVRLAGVPNRIGHDTEGRKALLTKALPYQDLQFEADSYCDLARAAFGIESFGRCRLRLSEEERQEGAARLGGIRVGFHPGGTLPSKTVPTHVSQHLVDECERRGIGLALVGGEGDAEAVSRLRLGPGVLNLVGTCSLRQTMGVLGCLDVLAGGDSGLIHIAAALGTRTVASFGAAKRVKWGHCYAPHHAFDVGVYMNRLVPEEYAAAVLD